MPLRETLPTERGMAEGVPQVLWQERGSGRLLCQRPRRRARGLAIFLRETNQCEAATVDYRASAAAKKQYMYAAAQEGTFVKGPSLPAAGAHRNKPTATTSPVRLPDVQHYREHTKTARNVSSYTAVLYAAIKGVGSPSRAPLPTR